MADYASHPEDISALWGPQPEGLLTPKAPGTNGGDPYATEPARTNRHRTADDQGNGKGIGSPAVERAAVEDISRLADAIAGNHVDVVRRSDLDGIRSDFAHQFAVALYELMAASNARLASAEDRINQRVTEALESHSSRLAASLEAHHRADDELSQTVAATLSTLTERCIGSIEGLPAFQRDLRHDVGRLSDLVREQGVESAARAEATIERMDRTEDHVAKAAGEMGEVLHAIEAIKEQLGQTREELVALRAVVEAGRTDTRRSVWRGRSR